MSFDHTNFSERRMPLLHKSQDVVGCSVIDVKTGTEVGIVSDLLFDAEPSLQGILLELNGWLHHQKYVAKEAFVIGSDVIILEGKEHMEAYHEEKPSWLSLVTGSRCLKGRQLLLSNGSELGMVENVYFMEEMGRIVAYELSDGIFSDWTTGRKLLKISQPLRWGENVLVAPADQAQILEN